MHSTFHHEMAAARIADLHYQAAQERTAKAAVCARPQRHQRTRSSAARTVTAVAHRVLTLLGARRPSPTR